MSEITMNYSGVALGYRYCTHQQYRQWHLITVMYEMTLNY